MFAPVPQQGTQELCHSQAGSEEAFLEVPQLSPQHVVSRYNGSNTTATEGNRNVIVVCGAGSSFWLLRGAGHLCEASKSPLLKVQTM